MFQALRVVLHPRALHNLTCAVPQVQSSFSARSKLGTKKPALAGRSTIACCSWGAWVTFNEVDRPWSSAKEGLYMSTASELHEFMANTASM